MFKTDKRYFSILKQGGNLYHLIKESDVLRWQPPNLKNSRKRDSPQSRRKWVFLKAMIHDAVHATLLDLATVLF